MSTRAIGAGSARLKADRQPPVVTAGPLDESEVQNGGPPPTAVIVCHGMGRQVRFETIDTVARTLSRAAAAHGDVVSVVTARLVGLHGRRLGRAELHVTGRDGRASVIHIYEAYWAPLTAGRVSGRDAVGFLIRSGWQGFRSSVLQGRFDRFIFNRWARYPIDLRTCLRFTASLAVLLSLFLVDVGGVLFLADWLVRSVQAMGPPRAPAGGWTLACAPLALCAGLLCAANCFVRWLLVQYVGDVAAYVSSSAADRFYRLRRDIQETCADVVRAVYGDRTYSACVLVGHSLGSVVAYDTLNALINEDHLSPHPSDVCRRTKLLLTLGSPLDKTAFIFRTERPESARVREALAAATQPLVVDYRHRPASWVNIWSRSDWISGPLDYYDDPAATDPRRVVNVEVRWASLSFLAHTKYWEHEAFGTRLYEAVVSEPAPVSSRPGPEP